MKKPIICVASDMTQLATLGPEAIETIRANCTFKITFPGNADDYVRPLIGTDKKPTDPQADN